MGGVRIWTKTTSSDPRFREGSDLGGWNPCRVFHLRVAGVDRRMRHGTLLVLAPVSGASTTLRHIGPKRCRQLRHPRASRSAGGEIAVDLAGLVQVVPHRVRGPQQKDHRGPAASKGVHAVSWGLGDLPIEASGRSGQKRALKIWSEVRIAMLVAGFALGAAWGFAAALNS